MCTRYLGRHWFQYMFMYIKYQPYINHICHRIYSICHSLEWHIWHRSEIYRIYVLLRWPHSKNISLRKQGVHDQGISQRNSSPIKSHRKSQGIWKWVREFRSKSGKSQGTLCHYKPISLNQNIWWNDIHIFETSNLVEHFTYVFINYTWFHIIFYFVFLDYYIAINGSYLYILHICSIYFIDTATSPHQLSQDIWWSKILPPKRIDILCFQRSCERAI